MKFIKYLTGFITIIFSVGIFQACDETLPEYKAPPDILTGRITIPDSGSSYYFSIRERFADPTKPPRVTFFTPDSIVFRFEVLNVYDEVIQDSSEVGGYLKIWDPVYPDNIAIVPFTSSSLSPYREILEIKPDEKIWLKTSWKKLLLQDGSYVWIGKTSDDTPDGRVRYGPFTLKAKAYIKLYKKLGLVITPDIEFKLDIVSTVIHPG
ncbi:MAG: hypothetical protein Q8K98_01015 [Bacteroidota bacterium]|nr:hypothetical protein [Bacteroidota bacterium]